MSNVSKNEEWIKNLLQFHKQRYEGLLKEHFSICLDSRHLQKLHKYNPCYFPLTDEFNPICQIKFFFTSIPFSWWISATIEPNIAQSIRVKPNWLKSVLKMNCSSTVCISTNDMLRFLHHWITTSHMTPTSDKLLMRKNALFSIGISE